MHRIIHRLVRLARLPFLVAGLVLALAGCGGDRIFAARGVPAATLEATLSRLADGSVKVHAVVSNTGTKTIQAGARCNEVWIQMSVHGPAGPIRLADPCIVGLSCPTGFVPLEPGDRVERNYGYDGHQYGETCNSLGTIPPGTYEIVVSFSWYAREKPLTLTRRLPFDWPAP